MRFKDHLRRGLTAWQPKKYRTLTAHPLREWVGTLFFWIIASIIIMFIIGIPKIMLIPEAVSQTASAFDEFNISAEVTLQEAQTLLTHPRIVVDLNKENLTKERVLITDEGIIVKKPFWQGNRLVSWSMLQDVKQAGDFYAKISSCLFLLLLPAISMISILIAILEAIALIIISASIAFIVIKITRFHLSFKQLIKICLISTIPFLMVQLIPFLYLRWLIIPLILYFLLVAASIWMVGESKMDRKSHHQEKDSK